MTNPYEPPDEMGSGLSHNAVPVSDLAKASRYLSLMGVVVIAHVCTVSMGLAGTCAADHKRPTAFRLMAILIPLVSIPLTVALMRPAFMLANDPAKYMPKARWLGIILGTFYFPFLTWPAYLAIRHMNRYIGNSRHR